MAAALRTVLRTSCALSSASLVFARATRSLATQLSQARSGGGTSLSATSPAATSLSATSLSATSPAATSSLAAASTASTTPPRLLNAIVVSAGLMQKTVKARVATVKFDRHIRKVSAPLACQPADGQNYKRTKHVLVHDERTSLRTGDVIAIAPGWRVSRHKRHVVDHIVAPFGEPVEARPAVETLVEREARQRDRSTDRSRGARAEVADEVEDEVADEVEDEVAE
jgi:small subunit ribosomal protein S17